MNIEIRKAVFGDAEALSELFTAFIGVASDLDAMRRTMAKIADDPDYFVAAACEAETVVGTAMGICCYDLVGNCNHFLLIENVVVAQSHRGRGVGKQLMEALENFASEHKCSYMILVSGNSRDGAHEFYKALGYSNDNQGFKKRLAPQV